MLLRAFASELVAHSLEHLAEQVLSSPSSRRPRVGVRRCSGVFLVSPRSGKLGAPPARCPRCDRRARLRRRAGERWRAASRGGRRARGTWRGSRLRSDAKVALHDDLFCGRGPAFGVERRHFAPERLLRFGDSVTRISASRASSPKRRAFSAIIHCSVHTWRRPFTANGAMCQLENGPWPEQHVAPLYGNALDGKLGRAERVL